MEQLLRKKWDSILELFVNEYEITEFTFKLWFEPLNIYSLDEGKKLITLNIDEPIAVERIDKRYKEPLKLIISSVLGEKYDIVILPTNQLTKESNILKANAKKQLNTFVSSNSTLNNKYTFDTFVVGKNNEFACAASLAVAEDPANAYNPFFLYGGVGLGKTHLMHAIGHHILSKNSNSKVLYVSSEKFTNELIDAIKSNKNEEFRQKYRYIDVLMIDDIQFLAGKERAQEEFFHTFNTLYDSKKQIIITSDRSPHEIETLEDRLRTRFKMGLTADINAPDYETRIAILRKKAEFENFYIDEEIIQYIASNIKSNIRELEGAMTKIVAHSKLLNKEPTLEQAVQAIKDLISPNENKEITPEYILETVCQHYNVPIEDLKSQKRNKGIAYPRQVVMYLARKYTDASLQTIGKLLGGRDHTTIMHGAEKVNSDYENDTVQHSNIEVIKKKLSL
jgi:chromosomal replication initiator protein